MAQKSGLLKYRWFGIKRRRRADKLAARLPSFRNSKLFQIRPSEEEKKRCIIVQCLRHLVHFIMIRDGGGYRDREAAFF